MSVDIHHSLGAIDARQWNALVGENDPFLEHEFLSALEESGSVGAHTAWEPRYLTLTRDDELIGALACYVKWDSYGEYIFDWQWADAYRRAGVPYYPKLVVGVPFTPVNGPRILIAEGEPFEECADAMLAQLEALARAEGISGIHFLFLPEREAVHLASRGYLSRITYQFHWENRGYATFEDFTADMRSSKRKQILKERRRVAELGLEVDVVAGDEVLPEHLDALWRFYRDTTGRKWGEAYLTRECFEAFSGGFRRRLVVVLAKEGGRAVAGALGAGKNAHLYGRYWGATAHYPGLHFECCYYRYIDYAIEHGMRLYEAGAQGEHKFLRGFAARPTYSSHWLTHPGGSAAIEAYLQQERPHMLATIEEYNRQSPLKHVRSPGADDLSAPR